MAKPPQITKHSGLLKFWPTYISVNNILFEFCTKSFHRYCVLEPELVFGTLNRVLGRHNAWLGGGAGTREQCTSPKTSSSPILGVLLLPNKQSLEEHKSLHCRSLKQGNVWRYRFGLFGKYAPGWALPCKKNLNGTFLWREGLVQAIHVCSL